MSAIVAKKAISFLAVLALVSFAFAAGYYFGRPSPNELAGLPAGWKVPPESVLGIWDQKGADTAASITFFSDWTFWYNSRPVMDRRIMGSFFIEGTQVTLRPLFYTRTSINDSLPTSLEILRSGSSVALRSEAGKVFQKPTD